jgi:hypothetical protein
MVKILKVFNEMSSKLRKVLFGVSKMGNEMVNSLHKVPNFEVLIGLRRSAKGKF